MDGSDKRVSSSTTPNKPPSIPKDKNDQSYQDMDLNVQNLKKLTTTTTTTATTRRFMSPTISAASKANPPRKKILAERNQSPDDTLVQRSPSFHSRITASTKYGDSDENAFADDLSSRPYDPLTNYLTPRPKFLRYKPNRCWEIFHCRENEVEEGKDGLNNSRIGSLEPKKGIDVEYDAGSSCCSSLVAGSQEGDVKEEGEEIDESDEEFEEIEEEEEEEEEEERGWGLKEIVKFLLLLVVLLVSTSYISSMNSPTPSCVVQSVVGLKDGYYIIQDQVHGFVKSLECGNYFLVEREETPMGSFDVDEIKEDGMVENAKMGGVEYSDEFSEVVEIQSGESDGLEMVENEEKAAVNAFVEGGETEAMEIVEHEEKGAVDELGDVVEMQAGEVADVSNLERVKTEEVSNLVEVNAMLQATEAVEIFEIPPVIDGVDCLAIVSAVAQGFEKETEVVYEPVKEELSDSEMGGIGNITDDYTDYEILIYEAEGSPWDGLIEPMKTGSLLKAVIGVSIFSLIISPLLLAFHFKRKRNAKKETSQVIKPGFEPVLAEQNNSVLAHNEDNCVENLASIANCNLIDSMEEDSKELCQSQAPSVELLGEFLLDNKSSSRRSNGMKSKMTKSDASSHSVSLEDVGSKAHSVPVRVQPALSEISSMSSPSYGRFTHDKKIGKNEKEGDGEASKMVTSPLRRSSRIRNRAISSP